MKKIIMKCPICGATRLQSLPPELWEKRESCKKGIIGIYVSEGTICDHDFVIYVDKNLSIRDVVSTDEAKHWKKNQLFCLTEIEALIQKLSPKSVKHILKVI